MRFIFMNEVGAFYSVVIHDGWSPRESGHDNLGANTCATIERRRGSFAQLRSNV